MLADHSPVQARENRPDKKANPEMKDVATNWFNQKEISAAHTAGKEK